MNLKLQGAEVDYGCLYVSASSLMPAHVPLPYVIRIDARAQHPRLTRRRRTPTPRRDVSALLENVTPFLKRYLVWHLLSFKYSFLKIDRLFNA